MFLKGSGVEVTTDNEQDLFMQYGSSVDALGRLAPETPFEVSKGIRHVLVTKGEVSDPAAFSIITEGTTVNFWRPIYDPTSQVRYEEIVSRLWAARPKGVRWFIDAVSYLELRGRENHKVV
jgi:hypothetical protein